MNVWKIGSRWGNLGTSVLDLFLNYECVFFGECYGSRIGAWDQVKPEDFFIICDGATPVALGKASGSFNTYEDSGIVFTDKDKEYIYDQVRICPATISIIPQEERKYYNGIDPRKRFCHYNNSDVIKDIPNRWKELSQKSDFKIVSRSVSLFSGVNCVFDSAVKYRIPIYQRPYSWSEKELRKLMESLHNAVRANEPVFMGTMQLSQPIPLDPYEKKKAYNIIDGQQRITTFLILCNVLEKNLSKTVMPYFADKLRTLVSRGEEQIKLDAYSEFINNSSNSGKNEWNIYIRNYRILETLLGEYFEQDQEETEYQNPTRKDLYDFINSNKIQLVVIETHAGLSKTLQIFNTINTTGMDLNAADLFKIRFYEYLKSQGEPETVFDQISDIYASIEEYNRTHIDEPGKLSMADVLRTYQRIIFAQNDLPQSVFNKSYETFFEELFDTLLGIRIYDEYKSFLKQDVKLSIGDLKKIIECYKESYKLLAVDWDYRIIRRLIWDTRYGYAWDLPIIARFFDSISEEQMSEFTMQQFKLLVPPSLYYAKTVYSVRSAIIDILRALPNKNENGIEKLKSCISTWLINGNSLEQMITEACKYEVTYNPKWKNLMCRIVEYWRNTDKNKNLYTKLFETPFDIEHIQCYTDKDDRDKTWSEWGVELNRIGNLVLLEQSINRSIGNDYSRKPVEYAKSQFLSVQELKNAVGTWTKDDAEKRREEITAQLVEFISGNKNDETSDI